jgi:SAM-dependent methyltransferase
VDLQRRLNAGLARQLGHPAGLAGRLVGRALNRGNRRAVTAAVDALAIPPGGVVADVGFGGGVGLSLLLDRVGAGGTVHGVEVSSEMLGRARRRFRAEIAAGRLQLHEGPIMELPLAPASLDGLVTTNTIYFVPELDRAFGAIAAALKPTGCAVIGLGDPDAMRAMPFTPYGFRIRSLDEVEAALGAAGLTVAEARRTGKEARPFHLLVATPSQGGRTGMAKR